MTASPAAARVLVVSNTVGEADQILRSLQDHFSHVSVSTGQDLAVRDFETYKPDVLVLGFDCLAKAQSYYLGLHDSVGAQRHPHRTVLLCNKDELRDAFELCKRHCFDDYVLYWPFSYDGLRLPMSIWNASRAMMALDERAQAVHSQTVREGRPLLMIVDDDEMTCDLLVRALKGTAFDILAVGDSTAALRELRCVRPDLIFMDIRLPGLDGVSLTRRLKSSPDWASIPIIMMTSDARRDTVTSSIEAGAVDFIAKPFTREALLTRLQNMLPD